MWLWRTLQKYRNFSLFAFFHAPALDLQLLQVKFNLLELSLLNHLIEGVENHYYHKTH